MSKDPECYYVLNITNPRVVEDIISGFLGGTVHYKNLLTIEHFAQYDTLAEAKKARRKQGGIILKGVNAI